jgi:hypothetical protein
MPEGQKSEEKGTLKVQYFFRGANEPRLKLFNLFPHGIG